MNADESAMARDAEVARLHPGGARKHVRATLPARVVLRAVEQHEGDDKIPLIGKTALTAVVDERGVRFYSGVNPVQDAGWIAAADITGVQTTTEINPTPPISQQVLRLSVADVGTHPLDVDLELLEFDGAGLRPSADVDGEAASWSGLLGRP